MLLMNKYKSHAFGLVSGVCHMQRCHPCSKISPPSSLFSTLLLFACALCCTKESILCSVVYFQALCLGRLMRKHGDTLCPHSDWRAALLESGFPAANGGCGDAASVWAFRFSCSCSQKESVMFVCLSAQPRCWTHSGPTPTPSPPHTKVALLCRLIVIWVSRALRPGAELKTHDSWDTPLLAHQPTGLLDTNWWVLNSQRLFSFTEVSCHFKLNLLHWWKLFSF